ncbi:MAG TPA: indolepyruvate ferredoxin oxidoreductase family protein [Thermoleophilaceae bacterium]|nr:indolepyruvate ferredoxin oxidoreductase family protein [Thermoleophilaceae bacterium]
MSIGQVPGEGVRTRRRFELAPHVRRDYSLEDRYELEDGRVFLTGIQALVRLAFDQNRADRRAGMRTGTFVSGYQGSPLGGLDREFAHQRALCERHDIFAVPGLNEELGATAAWGGQLAGNLPGARFDGVLSMWYGKAPGIDRATDALRHANYSGVSRTGGGMIVVGDDPNAKSSTVPSASESLLESLHVPTFYPGNVQEVLDLGRHAWACSRASGLWTALKIVTSVADAAGTTVVAPDRIAPVTPVIEWEGRPFEYTPNGNMLAPASLEMERTLLGPRTEAALAYVRANGLAPIERFGGQEWIGIVAAGKSYHDVRQALADMGLDDAGLARAGVRLLHPAMIWPLEPDAVREFAAGLDEIVVVEEKRPFVERQLKEILYGMTSAPRIVGKTDERGAPLLAAEGELDADAIARALGPRLLRRSRIDSVEARLAKLTEAARRPMPLPMAARTPFFCSGCPHNSSTPAPDGTLVGGGIGCHTMILLNPEGRGDITGITQMGGEGAQWIGMAPFTDRDHFVQNLGDGTFHHSGSLAIRAAVAAGVNVTYKLFYNDAVAMTGGQAVEGQIAIPDLTRWLEIEGVRRIIVTTEDTRRYRGVDLAGIAEVRDRSELLAAQEDLAGVEGVTVLIHDQECAAEKRRKRKRGKLEDPPQRVLINERVCEGCGDCGTKSSCLSVLPVETEFGRKTQIHQSSCNKDYTCLEGDCPSFLTVVPPRRKKEDEALSSMPPSDMPDPPRLFDPEEFTLRMMGIGGTGVVTISQVIGVAALLDGLHVAELDQTGLSQKGGPVTSDMRISREPREGSNRVSTASADLYLGFDVLGASSPKNLVVADPDRTVAVVSTAAVPTGGMVIDPTREFPVVDDQIRTIATFTRRELNVYLDAQLLAEKILGDHMPANMLALGAAWQRGALPLSRAAIERAIHLNGAAVEKNLAAFAWGRACVAAPEAVAALVDPPAPPRVEGLDGILEIRAPDLAEYQNDAYAGEYEAFVRDVAAVEDERVPGSTAVAESVARHLYKLMAYKDEYEVARLHLAALPEEGRFWFHLHPPVLRALGMKRKLKLGRWFVPVLRMLRSMRRLRGTPLDPFGLARVRRTERALIGEYEGLVASAVSALTPESHETAVELAELPDVIRGYEDIKLAGVERFRERAGVLLERLEV